MLHRLPLVLFLLFVIGLAIAWAIRSARRMEDFRTEQKIWSDALVHQPSDAMVYWGLGVASRSLGQSQRAIEHLQEAIRIEPKSSNAHAELASLYYQAGRLAEATREYEIAVRLYPVGADLHAQLGLLLAQANRSQEAIEHYHESLKLKPGAPAVWANLAMELSRVGLPDDAIAAAERGLAVAKRQDRPDLVDSIEGWLKSHRKHN